MGMRRWSLILLACAAPLAHAEMWKCVDAEGVTRYTNVKADAKGCKGIVLDPINTAPPTISDPMTCGSVIDESWTKAVLILPRRHPRFRESRS